MIVGFNHNINYKGVGFHVQTEDSGVKSPQLVTLLYHGGTIIASKKTVYADILKVENLSQVVEELAKEQHKGMLRSLTQGEFDQRIVTLNIPLEGVTLDVTPEPKAEESVAKPAISEHPVGEPAIVVEPQPESEVIEPVVEEQPFNPAVELLDQETDSEPEAFLAEPLIDKFRQSKERVRREPSLDDLIYAYLTGADKC